MPCVICSLLVCLGCWLLCVSQCMCTVDIDIVRSFGLHCDVWTPTEVYKHLDRSCWQQWGLIESCVYIVLVLAAARSDTAPRILSGFFFCFCCCCCFGGDRFCHWAQCTKAVNCIRVLLLFIAFYMASVMYSKFFQEVIHIDLSHSIILWVRCWNIMLNLTTVEETGVIKQH